MSAQQYCVTGADMVTERDRRLDYIQVIAGHTLDFYNALYNDVSDSKSELNGFGGKEDLNGMHSLKGIHVYCIGIRTWICMNFLKEHIV